MRRLSFALIALFIAAPGGAQVIRRGNMGASPPAVWVSGGAALTQGFDIADGTTGTTWRFGSGTSYQASIEKAAAGLSFGLRGATGLRSLLYTNTASGLSTDADARVSQLLATVHVAGDRGFHSVVELNAGVTNFSSFRARGTNATLPPSSDTDFSISFGYGFGYGFSNRFAVDVVRDMMLTVHQRTGLGANQDSNIQMHATRIEGRLGLGERQ